ncbi:VirK/YbjX family protein [Proteus myxofaciens]|uniref:VirK/YbjX family protein n=1 Tax=Proteus myxofaciens TaxID=184072 RepID=UPI0014289276|nr:VirK/YbjX family protein [Proteus myxofaciens]
MEKRSFLKFLIDILFNLTPKDGQWKEKKYRNRFILRLATNPISTIRYFHKLVSLDDFNKIIKIQPNLPAKIQRPYLHKFGNYETRGNDIINHYQIVHELSTKCKDIFYSKEPVCISKYNGKNNEEFSIYCSPSHFDREGELMLTLYMANIVISQLTFSFIKKDNINIIFIGALQGAQKNIEHNVIQQATKASYGLFPKRIIIEALYSISTSCFVYDILAVTETSHVFNHFLYKNKKRKKFLAVYSEFWNSIGGVPFYNFYKLPEKIKRKNLDDIVSKKRSEYRKRYALIDQINDEITSLLMSK